MIVFRQLIEKYLSYQTGRQWLFVRIYNLNKKATVHFLCEK